MISPPGSNFSKGAITSKGGWEDFRILGSPKIFKLTLDIVELQMKSKKKGLSP